jgi:hypothetical protein
MKVIRYLAVIVLSVLAGGLISYFGTKLEMISKLTAINRSASGGFPILDGPEFTLLVASGLGMIFGLFVSIILLVLEVNKIFGKLNTIKAILTGLLIGVAHMLIALSFGGLAKSNEEIFEMLFIFAEGVLIGLISVFLLKILVLNFDEYEKSR